jgi:hypothetical protein
MVVTFAPHLLTETSSSGLNDVLLSCLVSEVQKISSAGLEPRTWGGGGLLPLSL